MKVKESPMLEIGIFLPKRKVKYIASFGHGSQYMGQMPWFTLIREEYDMSEVVYAEMWTLKNLFNFLKRIKI